MLRFVRRRLAKGVASSNPQRDVRLPLAGSFLLALSLGACQAPLRNDVTTAKADQPAETFAAKWDRRIANPMEGRGDAP